MPFVDPTGARHLPQQQVFLRKGVGRSVKERSAEASLRQQETDTRSGTYGHTGKWEHSRRRTGG